MELGQEVEDPRGPGAGVLEHPALGAGLHHLGDEGHHIHELLLPLVEGLYDERLDVEFPHEDGPVPAQGHEAEPVAEVLQQRAVGEVGDALVAAQEHLQI